VPADWVPEEAREDVADIRESIRGALSLSSFRSVHFID